MKLLHTSDWHLGKRLENFSRFEEQQIVLAEICTIADNECVDAVVIAGDIFDTYNPPIEATELLYATLKKLSRNGTRPVVVIAGNHDSPDRIEAPDVIARINGIILIGYPYTKPHVFSIPDGFSVTQSDESFLELRLPGGELLRIIATPFANELRLRTFLGGNNEEVEQHLHNKWQTIADTYCNTNGVNILTTHALMSASNTDVVEEPEGEKPIENISALIQTNAIPQQIQYTALGHLHRYQNIGSQTTPVVYSGSPIAYSFSEAMQKKYVCIVELEAGKPANYTERQIHGGKVLIRKNNNSVEEALEWLQTVPDALVELHISCTEYLSHSDISRLKDVHKGIISIVPELPNLIKNSESNEKHIDLTKERKELLCEYFNFKYGMPPSVEIVSLFSEVLSQE